MGCGGRRIPAARPCQTRPSLNTVKLGSLDEVVRWMLGSWPGCVVGAFDVPFGHLAVDDAWRRALAADGVEPTEEPLEEHEPAGAVAAALVRGEKRPGGRWFGG